MTNYLSAAFWSVINEETSSLNKLYGEIEIKNDRMSPYNKIVIKNTNII